MKIIGIAETIFRALDDTIYATGVIFSRGSLVQKLRKLEPGYKKWEINRAITRFERDGFLGKRKGGISVTTRGMDRVNLYAYKRLLFSLPTKKWDRKWRMIIFDIPEHKRNLRHLFREKMKEWNCAKIQQSVFVTPFDCEKELEDLTTILRIGPYTHVIKVSDLGKSLSSKLLSYYKFA